MKWSLDTHKFMSEIVRTALQVIVEREITPQSSEAAVRAAEHELADRGVYKTKEAAEGRFRRTLLPYFKAYRLMTSEGALTALGRAFCEEKLSVKELCLHVLYGYEYVDDARGERYHPLERILSLTDYCTDACPEANYLSLEDFDELVKAEGNGVPDLAAIVRARSGRKEVDARSIGYDVWGYMLQESGLYQKNGNRQLKPVALPMIRFLLGAYRDGKQNGDWESPQNGYFANIPLPPCERRLVKNCSVLEAKTVSAFLFDDISIATINKLVCPKGGSATAMLAHYGLGETAKGAFADFSGYEHLVARAWRHADDPLVKSLGELIGSVQAGVVAPATLLAEAYALPAEEGAAQAAAPCRFDSSKTGGRNCVFYGTPGCGKSFYVQHRYLPTCGVAPEHCIRTTFYMDYTNTDFVGQILPRRKASGEVTYSFVPGPFALALKLALENPDAPVALVIEELNRGHAAAIFGDLFQLLDRDENGKSRYPITHVNLQDYLETCFAGRYTFDRISIPANLFLVATMNTSDQNVFTLDTAFKRRWQLHKLRNVFTAEHTYKDYFVPGLAHVTWEKLVTALNRFIVSRQDDLASEDKQLGVYFMEKEALCRTPEEGDNPAMRERFAGKLLEYLWDDVAKYARADWFAADIVTLDDLIEGYKAHGALVFSDGVRELL